MIIPIYQGSIIPYITQPNGVLMRRFSDSMQIQVKLPRPRVGRSISISENEKRLKTTSGNQLKRSIQKTTNYICHDHCKCLWDAVFFCCSNCMVSCCTPKSQVSAKTKKGGFDHCSSVPGSPADQTKWLAFRMIHTSRITDPTNGQSLVFGLPGYIYIFHIYNIRLKKKTMSTLKTWGKCYIDVILSYFLAMPWDPITERQRMMIEVSFITSEKVSQDT